MTYSNLNSEQKLLIKNQNLVYEELQIFQHKVLDIFKQLDFTFVFTGGTALSLIYLNNHRRSYDMDFFGTFSSNQDDIFADFEAKLLDSNIHIISKTNITGELKMLKYIVACRINSEEVLMKIEFVEDDFYSILYQNRIEKIDHLESIYFRKIYTLTSFNNERIKDLIDLYYLNNHLDILSFFNNYFKKSFETLTNNSMTFNNQIICNSINAWLRYIFHEETRIKEELETYGSSTEIEEISAHIREFCTNLCYNKQK